MKSGKTGIHIRGYELLSKEEVDNKIKIYGTLEYFQMIELY